MRVSAWRFLDRSGNNKTVLARADTFKQAQIKAMKKVDGPSTAFDLIIQVRLQKSGRHFWKEVYGREIRRVFEDLED